MIRNTMRWTEVSHGEHNNSAPTIKNHSVTHFNGYLFCFGGYDGRRNHLTLLVYKIDEQRWIRPLQYHPAIAAAVPSAVHYDPTGSTATNTHLLNNNFGEDIHNNGNVILSGISNNNNNNNNMHHPGSIGNIMNDPTIVVQGTPPPGRNGHSATLAADDDDAEHAKIVIIGGWLGTGPLAASDMHVLDVSAGGKHLRWYQPAVKGSPPGPCNMHSADYVKQLREIYVFRGGNGREYLNDLHALNVDTLTWRKVETNGERPQPRANHSSAILEETCELCLFGGWNGGERLNDIHILNIETSMWTRPRVGGVLPHPRAGMTLTALRGRLMLFGGSGTSAKCFNDLQILDRQEMVWLDVTQNGDEARSGSSVSSSNHMTMIPHDYEADDSLTFRFGGDYMYGGGPSRGANTNSQSSPQHGEFSDEGSTSRPHHSYSSSRADWNTRDMAGQIQHAAASVQSMHVSPNPNDEDTVPTVLIHGRGPGRRAGHTATAVNRKIYIFGGSCGSDYLNDFFVLDTDPPPRAMVSEATNLQLLERRLCHFFNDEEFSDVTFLVQGQKVYGHKMVLSIVSDCFRAMFTTGFRESQALEIEIPDCSHAAFLAVMEYIYTGALPKSLTLNSNGGQHGQQPQIPDDRQIARIVEILELADRFFLDHLKQVCESMLQGAVNSYTVIFLLTVAQKTNANQLQAICEHFIRNRIDNRNMLPNNASS